MSSKGTIITRFPPSPTGFFHVGSVRTALFNYLFARKNKGKFTLRIEDTDTERSKREFEQDIFESLAWLGLEYDNKDIVRQSEWKEVYRKYLQQLIDSGHAYVSKEAGGKDADGKALRSEVIRFKNPNKRVTFQDLIRGEVSMDTSDLKDFVIAKSLDEPLYHMAVVVDDMESGVTHVIRGEDHISNTPRQILILEALGGKRPIYAHLPLILAEDKSKLSKRKHGEKVSLKYYREEGFLPEAIINYIALLGWNPGTEQELFTLAELISTFDIARVQKSGAVFSDEKLRWFNKEYMKKLPESEFISKILDSLKNSEKVSTSESLKKFQTLTAKDIKKLYEILLERSSTFGDMRRMFETGELDYSVEEPTYPATALFWKLQGSPDAEQKTALIRRLEHVIQSLKNIDEKDFRKDIIKSALFEYATAEGRGNVLWPMRYALSGREKSPDPFVLAELLGKEKTLERLARALDLVSHE
jgi:glutamyl-tRNA synthetase